MIAFGIWGAIFVGRRIDHGFAIWLIGGLLAHDLVVAPLVFGAGAVLRRTVPEAYRGAVTAALVVSAMFVVASIPVLGRFGARPDNATLLPRDYTTGLLVVLAIVWSATAIVLVRAWRNRSRQT